jgi:hypothetical protein
MMSLRSIRFRMKRIDPEYPFARLHLQVTR